MSKGGKYHGRRIQWVTNFEQNFIFKLSKTFLIVFLSFLSLRYLI